jgi:molybdate transport system substrate-binding protein
LLRQRTSLILKKQGKIVPGSTVAIAKTGIGVAVRSGTPKPDLSSVDAFKRYLLSAKSIGYVDPSGGAGPSRPIVAMFERLGIDAELRAKAKFVPNGRSLFEAINKQDADVGVYIINEIVTTPGIELAGPVPPEVQFYIRYAAGILAASTEPASARELITFLASPIALPVIKAKGMERD